MALSAQLPLLISLVDGWDSSFQSGWSSTLVSSCRPFRPVNLCSLLDVSLLVSVLVSCLPWVRQLCSLRTLKSIAFCMCTNSVSSHVPIRDRTQMDSWRDCWILPTCYYYWSPVSCYCEQCHKIPRRLWIISHPDRHPVPMGHHFGSRVCHCSTLQTRLGLIKTFRLFILPDTPRWFIKEDRYEDAAKALGKLRRLPVDHPAVLEELNEVQANHLYEMSLGKASYIECCKGTLGKRLLTGCLLQALQQLTGVNFICKQIQLVYALISC